MMLRIGTRGSALALKQTALFCEALGRFHPALEFDVRQVVTSGDRKQGTPAAAVGDKKDWIAELEKGLLAGEFDIAIHSAKDVPIDIEPETTLGAILERAAPNETLLLNEKLGKPASASLACLAPGATIGTASIRREAQIRWLRPDVNVVPVRGNVTTRVRKLSEENLSALVLAAAGLDRLALLSDQGALLSTDEMLPAVNQGILVAQLRKNDAKTSALIDPLRHHDTAVCFAAERAVIERLGADCHSAVGVHARLVHGVLELRAEVYHRTERRRIEAAVNGNPELATELGTSLGDSLLAQGAKELL